MKNTIDYTKIKLLCIDLQGNELKALQSMSDYIKSVQVIICEAQYEKCYENSCLFEEIYHYLLKYNFVCLNYNHNKEKAFSDFIFVKK